MRRLLRLQVELVGARRSNRRKLLLERGRHGAGFYDVAICSLYLVDSIKSHGTLCMSVGAVVALNVELAVRTGRSFHLEIIS
jgi:hypothetical protein